MSIQRKIVRKASQIVREAGENLLPLVAEGAARATELAADGTRRTADAARDWADDVQGVTMRRRLLAGLGVVAILSAVVVYLTSSSGDKAIKKLPKPVRAVIEKAS